MNGPAVGALFLVGLIVVVSGTDSVHAALAFERISILEGRELWRIVSGQFIHGTPRLLLIDALSVGILGWFVERQVGTRALLEVALISAMAAGLGTLWLRPDILCLQGASGVASGFLAVTLWHLAAAGNRRQRRWVALAATALAVKLMFEASAAGEPAWWWEGASGASVVAEAHAGGAAAGIVWAALRLVNAHGRLRPRAVPCPHLYSAR